MEIPTGKFQLKAPPVREGFLLLFLAFLTCGLYYPAIFAPFCMLDDRILELDILNNPEWSYLKIVFGSNEGGTYGGPYFRPFSTLVFFIIAKIFGLQPEPFHFFNILLHLGSGLVIYLIVKRLYSETLPGIWVAFLAALTFLLHPVNVEAVAWVSGRPTLLCTFLVLAALYCHLRVTRGLRDWYLWTAGFCYLLSLLTYELAAAIPLAFVYWDLDQNRDRPWRKSVRSCLSRWLVYGVVLTSYGAYRMGRGMTEPNPESVGGSILINVLDAFLEHLSSPFVAIGFYLKKLFWPWPLSWYISHISPMPRFLYLGLGVAFLVILPWWVWKRSWPRFWALWFLCGLFVALPLSFHSFSWTPAAERYAYLAAVAFAVCLSLFVFKVINSRPGRVALTVWVLVVGLLIVFAVSTTLRTTVWQSNVALLRDTWEQNPTSGRIACAYAWALHEVGRVEEGVSLWHKAMELGYVSAPAQALGDLERGKKNYEAAERYYLQALWPFGKLAEGGARNVDELGILHKRDPEVYLALADVHHKMAEKNPACRKYHARRIIHFHEAACKLKPADAHLRYLLAKAYLRFGHLEEARKHFVQVRDMAPDTYYGKAAAKLANAEKRTGGAGEAGLPADMEPPPDDERGEAECGSSG